ncbi:MAG: transcription termination factor NusA [Candidatus Auribacterota bacterium]|jgi:N utilization substance protein A|uniref:Transcription termination/antitermination protein NusA n=1 Tax=Candidatus Auribacter fodinae TaxID=2093366 RepID=A0A3A4QYE8_9BACT|nr:MAG: transcription termination/antitermination protein NusA [Candidatus Auribacter fodinae]
MNGELLTVLEHLEREKRIKREVLIQAIESSILTASKKRLGKNNDISIKIDDKTGEIKVFASFEVVKEIEDENGEITLSEAKKINPKAKIGDMINKEITPENFGRIAAQTAKQVIIQKIREAEREIVYNEYKDRIGDIVNGIIRRNERGAFIIDLGRTEGILPSKEQCPTEDYANGYRMRFYIVDVRTSSRGPEIVLSRTHPGFVERLFELEVPEIAEGTVEIKAVSREPGYRSKIAVTSTLDKVDSVGACVGLRGERVKNIVRELNGEKIDIVRYSPNISSFVENALSPAKLKSIRLDESANTMTIIVPEDQFSLAIGKKGQNARLTAKLVGWKIDIKREGDVDAVTAFTPKVELTSIPGVPDKIVADLIAAGFKTPGDLDSVDLDVIKSFKGVGEKTAPKIYDAIKAFASKEKSKTKLDALIAEKSKEINN